MSTRVYTPRLNIDGTECCGNEPWRGRFCQYHQGFDDGAESVIEAGERMRRAMLQYMLMLASDGDEAEPLAQLRKAVREWKEVTGVEA